MKITLSNVEGLLEQFKEEEKKEEEDKWKFNCVLMAKKYEDVSALSTNDLFDVMRQMRKYTFAEKDAAEDLSDLVSGLLKSPRARRARLL